MPGGKKFFLAPSLTTTAGELKNGNGLNKHRLRYLSHAIATLELRYETAATLLLRGVLRRDNPQHRSILQQYAETADEGAAAKQEGSQAAPAASHAASAARAGKRKRQRREERRQGQQHEEEPQPRAKRRQRQQQREEEEEDVIDLTRVPPPGDEVLAAQAQDETLQCDLTASEAPRWRAVKKEVVEVE